jgi:hypothetical protein
MLGRTKGAALALALLVIGVGAANAPATASAASWHHVHFHMNAYSGSDALGRERTCTEESSAPTGTCHGLGESIPDSWPFNTDVDWIWGQLATYRCPHMSTPAGYSRRLDLFTSKETAEIGGWTPRAELCGWVDRNWGTFTVTSGQFQAGAHLAHAAGIHPTGTDPAKREQQGGPLFVHYSHHGNDHGGYVMGLRGWLYY